MAQDGMSMCMKSTMSLSAAISNFKFLYICIAFVAIDVKYMNNSMAYILRIIIFNKYFSNEIVSFSVSNA